MANPIMAATAASISELKRNPMATVMAAGGQPIVILNHNQPAFYCIPAEAYQQLLDRLEDAELNHIADQRQQQAMIMVNIDEL